jgi:hypothetical protein
MSARLALLWTRLQSRVVGAGKDRGDVPGWVLVTVMTAGIVMALWVVAEPELRTLLHRALHITGDPNR